MYLLWTERPVRLPREEETHAWMEANRPWEKFGLELVFDNQPGGWVRFSNVFADLWERCREEATGFINVESDVVPNLEAFEEVLKCAEDVCLVPFIWSREGIWGAWIEERVPGGWNTRTAQPGDRWAMEGDTGFVRFREGVPGRFQLLPTVRLKEVNGIMYSEVYKSIGRKIHLHWPNGTGLRNNHFYWDEGNFAQTPRELWPARWNDRAGIMDPRLKGPTSERQI